MITHSVQYLSTLTIIGLLSLAPELEANQMLVRKKSSEYYSEVLAEIDCKSNELFTKDVSLGFPLINLSTSCLSKHFQLNSTIVPSPIFSE